MGCDIHMTLERRIEGAWHCIWDGRVRPRVKTYRENNTTDDSYQSTIVRNRNYGFFARLAGVRGLGPEAKGLPDDISPVTKHIIDSWGDDGHSHSWDTLADFCRKWAYESPDEEKVEFVKEQLTGNQRKDYVQYLFGMYSDESPEDVRVVYWFDN